MCRFRYYSWLTIPKYSTNIYIGASDFIIFIMGPMLQEMVKNEFIIKVVNLLPTNHVMEALQKVIKGEGFIAIQEHILNNTIWTICLIILCIIVYKRNN